jgi:predicted DNA-binding transcriptional regulator AlpA
MSDASPLKVDAPDPYDAFLDSLDSRALALRDRFNIISEHDLSILLGLDSRTLAAWRAKNFGPPVVKLGRGVFYRRADVDAWIAQKTPNV